MGRPRKSTNVKQRTVYVYVPNDEILSDWKHAAKTAGVSISAFVQEAMELYLARNDPLLSKQTLDERYRESLVTIDTLKEENKKLYQKLERMDTLLD
jgi:post-segregation antitoxin (ccd killing protein)